MVLPVRSDTDLISGRAMRRATSRSVLFDDVGAVPSESVGFELFAFCSRTGSVVAVVGKSAPPVAGSTGSREVLVLAQAATAPLGRRADMLAAFESGRGA